MNSLTNKLINTCSEMCYCSPPHLADVMIGIIIILFWFVIFFIIMKKTN